MPPTGRPGSMPAKRVTALRAMARIIASSPRISAWKSISASCSGVSASIAPPAPAWGAPSARSPSGGTCPSPSPSASNEPSPARSEK